MTLQALKDHLYDIVAKYFTTADVAWSESNSARPPLPFVRLKTGSVVVSSMPMVEDNNGILNNLYGMKTTLEVNLYTRGTEIGGTGEEGDRINTAVSDLLDFLSYINSPMTSDTAEALNITIRPNGAVQDVTALLNDTSHEYRAMVELSVDFLYESVGKAGVTPDWVPSPSGGGSKELASAETGYFEKVVVKEEKQK